MSRQRDRATGQKKNPPAFPRRAALADGVWVLVTRRARVARVRSWVQGVVIQNVVRGKVVVFIPVVVSVITFTPLYGGYSAGCDAQKCQSGGVKARVIQSVRVGRVMPSGCKVGSGHTEQSHPDLSR